MATGVLKVQGNRIVDPAGKPVRLRGFGLGGWMNMENFITGHPANEEAVRRALKKTLGEDRYTFFFDRFLEYFFTEADAAYLKSLGLNLLRLPLNYRHFQNEKGFRHLDRVVKLCAANNIYTILDLHAFPGGQNMHWHSDNPTHKALFWEYPHFLEQSVHLWKALARRYRGNGWVAGYNLMNEPADETGERIVPVTKRLLDAAREEDPDHIAFVEGNRYSVDFSCFGEPWPNTVYTHHDYALPGFVAGGPYPGLTRGRHVDKAELEKTFLTKSEYMLLTRTPIWVGEFGPVYPQDRPETHAMRLQILKDQIAIYEKHGAHWALWTYKDIGLQGLATAAPDSPWMQLLNPFLEKKARLGADSWGGTDASIRDVMEPLEKLYTREFPGYEPYPFGALQMIQLLVRNILLSEPLIEDFAALFKGLTESQLDDLLSSFRFERCVQRTPLAQALRESHPSGEAHAG